MSDAGETEVIAPLDLHRRLTGMPRPADHLARRTTLNRKLRQAFYREAEDEAARRGRPFDKAELCRVLRPCLATMADARRHANTECPYCGLRLDLSKARRSVRHAGRRSGSGRDQTDLMYLLKKPTSRPSRRHGSSMATRRREISSTTRTCSAASLST